MRSSRSRSTAALSIHKSRVLVTVGVFIAGLVTAPIALAPAAAASPGVAAQTPVSDGLATPADPTTSSEAEKAWLQAADDAEAMNEKVLVATDVEQSARAQAAAAAKTVTVKQQAAAAAQAEVRQAASVSVGAAQKLKVAAASEADYQGQVDAFTDASFRGAHFGSMSAMLTASSPDDFLETASTLDVIADNTSDTLAQAARSKQRAATARTTAQSAAAAAATAQSNADGALQDASDAKTRADSLLTSAHHAAAKLKSQQAQLKSEAARLKKLQSTLSEQEQAAALARRQAAAEAAAQAAAQAAQARADRSRNTAPRSDTVGSGAGKNSSGTTKADGAPAPAAAPAGAASSAAEAAVRFALSKVGSRYVFGTAGPNTFDCSGLTSWAYAQAGVSIPRTSGGQSQLQYVSMDQLRPGDLVTYYSPVHHVAMYIGNGKVVNASTSSKPVLVTSVNYGAPNATGHRVVG